MDILYINHYAGSIYHGMEYRPYYLAREWVRLGHKVTIVASSYSHLRQKNITYPDNKQKYSYETIDGIDYIWCETPKYTSNGIWRLYNIFIFLRRISAIKAYLTNVIKPDLVIASSTHPFDNYLAHKIAKKAYAKYIYEVHDLWPLSPLELGKMSKYHPFIYLTQLAENFAYKHAHKVVSLLPKALPYMQEHGLHPDKFVYIPNGIDLEYQSDELPEHHQNFITEIKAKYNFVLGYAGGMATGNSLYCVLEAFAQIKDKSLALILMGDGINRVNLIQYVTSNQIYNVFFLPSVAKNQVKQFLMQMDALYIGFPKLALYRFGISPNKIFDYMFAKKPIIYAVEAGNNFITDANCGVAIAADNVEQIVRALLQLYHMDKDELAILGNNGYNYVVKYHNYKYLAQKFISVCTAQSVCHITSVHPRHDIRIFIKECQSLAEYGYQVRLIVADGLGNDFINYTDKTTKVNIYDVGKYSGRLQRMLFTPPKIYNEIIRLRSDIVHFHDPELMLIGLKLAKRGFRVIYDIHENLPKQILSKYWVKKPLRKIIAYTLNQLEIYTVKRIAGVITVVESIAARFRAINSNIEIVHNYPRLAEIHELMLDIPWAKREDKLVYIGGISIIRGIAVVLQSLTLTNLNLELAGTLSGISQEELVQLPGFELVNFYGLLSYAAAFKLLTTAKIGILTLLPTPNHVESLPNKLFEYMAAGIPIVASNFSNWQEIITKYDCGICVDPTDPAAIAQACQYLLNNQDIASRMGQNGQMAVLNIFNWEAEMDKLLSFYKNLL